MKKILFLYFLFISAISYGQEVTFKTIYKDQPFQLNSGGRALLGGQSRTYLAVEIPQNAIGLIYTVNSNMDYDASGDIKLAAYLTANCTGNFVLANAIENMPTPKSNAVIDVFVISDENNYIGYFLSKQDQNWRCYTDYSCPSSLGCKHAIRVSHGMKKVYIALRNPSSVNRITALVNVVAVLPKEETKNGWTKNQRQEIYESAKKVLNKELNSYSEENLEKIASCFVSSLIEKYAPSDINSMAEYEKKEITESTFKHCKEQISR